MKTTFAGEVGSRIRSIRERLRVTRKELAEDAGISVGYLAEVEKGNTSVSLIKVVNIAWALGVPLSYLLPR